MGRSFRIGLPEALASVAALAAALASLAGFMPGLYRDRAVVVAQSHGYDLGNLVAVVVLLVALAAAARGSVAGRLVAVGALGCLLYGYVTYAFLIVLNPATPLYILVLGCGGWALATGLASVDQGALGAAVHLRRRAAAIYLLLLALFFAFAWLGQLGTSIASGNPPADLAAAGWPMNPVYVLDLACVLPLMALAGAWLLRRHAGAARLAIPLLVFQALLAVTILAMGAGQALDRQTFDPALLALFVVVAVVSTSLVLDALDLRLHPSARHTAWEAPR